MPEVSDKSNEKTLEMTVHEAEEFTKRIVFHDGMLGCWWWSGPTDKSGYGRFSHRGKRVPAHVASYIRLKGSYPPGWQVDHTCHNRLCLNPGHLRATPKPGSLHRRKHVTAMTGAERQHKHRSKKRQRQDAIMLVLKLKDEFRINDYEIGLDTPPPAHLNVSCYSEWDTLEP